MSLFDRLRAWWTRLRKRTPAARVAAQALASPPDGSPAFIKILHTQDGRRQSLYAGTNERSAKSVWRALHDQQPQTPGSAEYRRNGVLRGTYTGPEA